MVTSSELELLLRRLKQEKSITYMVVLDNALKDEKLHCLDIYLKNGKCIHIGYPRFKKEYFYRVRKPEGYLDVGLFEILVFEKDDDDSKTNQTTRYLIDPDNINDITFKWQFFNEKLLKEIDGDGDQDSESKDQE